MHVASEWASVARSWLDASSDSVVRFKTLTIVRLLIPHLADSEFDVAFVMSATRALYAGLMELESAAHEADAEVARQRAFEQQQATDQQQQQQQPQAVGCGVCAVANVAATASGGEDTYGSARKIEKVRLEDGKDEVRKHGKGGRQRPQHHR